MRSAQRFIAALIISGSLLTIDAAQAATETFTYDALGRVSAVTSESGATRSYTYDNADNLLQITLGGSFAAVTDTPESNMSKQASRDQHPVSNMPVTLAEAVQVAKRSQGQAETAREEWYASQNRDETLRLAR